MKIVIGISYYYPNISGLTIYAQNLAESLADKNEVTVVTSNPKGFKRTEKLNGVRVRRFWTPLLLGRGPVMPLYFWEVLKEMRKVQIVNYHIPSFEVLFFCIAAKILRKRIVLTHHCDLSNWPGFVNQITEKVTYFSLLVSGLLADRIVVYTKDYADNSGFLKHFKHKLEYVLPPVKVEKPKGKLKKEYKNVKYKIGFAGRIAREKGIGYLIETLPILKKTLGKNIKIFIAGPSEVIGGGNIKTLEKLFEKYSENIVLLGPLNQKQMADFYEMLNVLVLPSTEKIESFGFVQVEAMKLGCPVIASDMPGVRMPTTLSGMGLRTPLKNIKKMAENIIKVINNKEDYLKGKREIDKIFNFNDTIHAYENLFQRLLKK